jgi:hypothetical protein
MGLCLFDYGSSKITYEDVALEDNIFNRCHTLDRYGWQDKEVGTKYKRYDVHGCSVVGETYCGEKAGAAAEVESRRCNIRNK